MLSLWKIRALVNFSLFSSNSSSKLSKGLESVLINLEKMYALHVIVQDTFHEIVLMVVEAVMDTVVILILLHRDMIVVTLTLQAVVLLIIGADLVLLRNLILLVSKDIMDTMIIADILLLLSRAMITITTDHRHRRNILQLLHLSHNRTDILLLHLRRLLMIPILQEDPHILLNSTIRITTNTDLRILAVYKS
jgi:hypothetical protein